MSTTDETHDSLFYPGTDVPRLSVDARPAVSDVGQTEAVLSPTEVVNQHFIPRAYLKPFEEAERRIWVTAVDASSHRRSSSKAVATRPHGYNIPIAGGHLSVEDWLSRNVENPGFPVIHRLIAEPASITRLTATEEVALARFVAALLSRVPKRHAEAQAVVHEIVAHMKEFHRNSIRKQLGSETGTEWFEYWDAEPDYVWLGDSEPLDFPVFAAEALSEMNDKASVFLSMPWTCGTSRLPLFTSDNPVSRVAGRRPPNADPYG